MKCSIKTTKGRKNSGKKIRTKNRGKEQKTVTNMVNSNPTIFIITLNVQSLNGPIKTHTLSAHQKGRSNNCIFIRNSF